LLYTLMKQCIPLHRCKRLYNKKGEMSISAFSPLNTIINLHVSEKLQLRRLLFFSNSPHLTFSSFCAACE
jgi:hypothetical protein